MLNLILFGKPGSGKGTQASFLKNKYGLVHISTGDVFRKNIKTETELGLKAKLYAERGELVPDQITVSMLEDEIKQNLPCLGFIFDGFPRTIYQANEMNKILSKYVLDLTATIALNVDDNLLKADVTIPYWTGNVILSHIFRLGVHLLGIVEGFWEYV